MPRSVKDGKIRVGVDGVTEDSLSVIAVARSDGFGITYDGFTGNIELRRAGTPLATVSVVDTGNIELSCVGTTISVLSGGSTLVTTTQTLYNSAGDWYCTGSLGLCWEVSFVSYDSVGTVHQGTSALTASLNAANAARAVYVAIASPSAAASLVSSGSASYSASLVATASLSQQSSGILTLLASLAASGSMAAEGGGSLVFGASSHPMASALLGSSAVKVLIGQSANSGSLTVTVDGVRCAIGTPEALASSLGVSAAALIALVAELSAVGSVTVDVTAIANYAAGATLTGSAAQGADGQSIQVLWRTSTEDIGSWEASTDGGAVWTRADEIVTTWS